MKRERTAIWRRALTFRGLLPLMVAAVTLTISSCTKEPMPPAGQPDKEYMDFSLELTPPGAYTDATKALPPAAQNAINRVEVLVFQGNNLRYHKTGIITDIDGVKKRVQVNLRTSRDETDLFDIMVIGNPPASFKFADYVNKSTGQLKAGFNVMTTGQWHGSEFVMYGEIMKTLIKPTTNNFKIQMLRSLARIDVGVGAYDEATDTWSGLADFKLSEVRVVNTRNMFAAIPSATTLDASGNVKVDAPTIPGYAEVQGKNAGTAVRYADSDITQVGVSTKSTIFISEAPNTTERVTLIIGGSYKGGATTFYHVDMCVPKAGATGSYDYLNILRNHLYRVTITDVMGEGFTDPQQALDAPSLNIKVDMTAAPEGGAGGDIIFDGNSYLMTYVSSVLLNTSPDGIRKIDLFYVKAGFGSGTVANVTGPGITTPISLTNGVNQLISVVIPASTTSGEYTITVGRLTKKIKLFYPTRTSVEVDAHFDVLPYMNVASMKIANPKPWITLSQNMTYLPSEQQSADIVGNAQGKAYIHFDENIVTSGPPRTAEVFVTRTDGSTMLVAITQRNLSGQVLGYGGGVKDAYGYTREVAVESIEEFNTRVYDDTSIGSVQEGMQWGFNNKITGASSKVSGLAGTIALVKRTDSGITGPYTIYNNYPARYCFDKNRDVNGNGVIDDDEVVWYMPSINQLMLVWIAHTAVTYPFNGTSRYWSGTESFGDSSIFLYFENAKMSVVTKQFIYRARCVREI